MSQAPITHTGAGRVAAVIVSPKAKKAFQSTTLYQHQSTLRLVLQCLGISQLPGSSSTAPDMGEFLLDSRESRMDTTALEEFAR